jgi:hypothetical protein
MRIMKTMLIFTSLLAGFALFEALAYRYGAESRPGFDERPERAVHRTI